MANLIRWRRGHRGKGENNEQCNNVGQGNKLSRPLRLIVFAFRYDLLTPRHIGALRTSHSWLVHPTDHNTTALTGRSGAPHLPRVDSPDHRLSCRHSRGTRLRGTRRSDGPETRPAARLEEVLYLRGATVGYSVSKPEF
jgi:hypothetical protein